MKYQAKTLVDLHENSKIEELLHVAKKLYGLEGVEETIVHDEEEDNKCIMFLRQQIPGGKYGVMYICTSYIC